MHLSAGSGINRASRAGKNNFIKVTGFAAENLFRHVQNAIQTQGKEQQAREFSINTNKTNAYKKLYKSFFCIVRLASH